MFRQHHSDAGVPEELTDKILAEMTALNDAIAGDRTNLGEGFRIGHSFFTPEDGKGPFGESWYRRIVRNEIIPLLNEYWFDDPETADEWRDRLHK